MPEFRIMLSPMYSARSFIIFCALLAFAGVSRAQITGIKIAGDTCTSLTLDLQALGTSSSPYFFWNFGDPASGTNDTITITGASSSPFPTHTFSGPGVYTVCVSLQEPGSPVTTICRTISIGLCCTGIIKFTDSCQNRPATFSVQTSATVVSISWNFGDPASGAANASTAISPSHVFSSAGVYTVSAFVTALCDTFSIAYPITIVNCGVVPCTGVVSMQDSCFGNGATFSLNSSSSISSYSWSFGDPATGSANNSTAAMPGHLFSAPGTYTISITAVASCGTFSVSYVANIISCSSNCRANIGFKDSCAGNVSLFRLETNSTINSVSWNFGDPASGQSNTSGSTTSTHVFVTPGTYQVTAVTNLVCSTLVVTRDITIVNCVNEPEGCSGILPSGFTPNADGQNDIFYVRSEDIKSIRSLRVYNRWGQLLFDKEGGAPNDDSFGWDGKFRGEICGPDIYMWYVEAVCNSGKIVILKGDVMIIR